MMSYDLQSLTPDMEVGAAPITPLIAPVTPPTYTAAVAEEMWLRFPTTGPSAAYGPPFPRGTSLGLVYTGLDTQSSSVSRKKGGTLAAIPCYNEELRIGSIILLCRHFVDEVLVVDDGSSDNTADVAMEAGATVIRHEGNKGYGGALRTSFDYARTHGIDRVVILDGDGQHRPADIPSFFKTMDTSGADVVIGSRFLKLKIAMPLYRRFGMRVLDLVTKAAGSVEATDTQCGYRAYGRRAIEGIGITDDAMGAGSEILARAAELNLRVAEVPVEVRYDLEGTSSQNPLSHGLDVLDSVIWGLVRKRPFSFIGMPGVVLVLLGLSAGTIGIGDYIHTGNFLSLPYALLISILIMVGMIGLFAGLTLNLIIRAKRV